MQLQQLLRQVPKSAEDVVSRSSQSKRVLRSVQCSNEEAIAADYEQRLAFIQKQHEKMLGALHREVDQLKRKNKGP